MNRPFDAMLRSRGLRLSKAENTFGIESVVRAERDGDLVHVDLQFFPRDQVLPSWLGNPNRVVAVLDDMANTRLPVRAAVPLRDRLRVTVAAPAEVKRFVLRIDGLITGLDSVDVSLQEDDPAFDPAPPPAPAPVVEPPILVDYLAKDFASFKRLILDSIAHELPAMTERHEADVAIAVVEVLAFAADHLSYFQDAVATEAYLQTARRRVSVRRHARLVGYRLHEGCTPRVWIHVEPLTAFELPRGFAVATGSDDAMARRVFETLEPIALDPAVTELELWDNATDDFTLRAGTTQAFLAVPAVLEGGPPTELLKAGTVLIFEQRVDPATGRRVSPRFRQAVRLRDDARERSHPLDPKRRLLRIAWAEEDKLAFDFPVRTPSGSTRATVVLGNVVPADYGETKPMTDPVGVDATWTMRMLVPELTFAVPYAEANAPASQLTAIKPYKAEPALTVRASAFNETAEWHGRRDLLGADPFDRVFAVEVERTGLAMLRFGDGVNGWRPDASARFDVVYRSGNGTTGHVGADTITEVVTRETRIKHVRNPLPSSGGQDPLDLVRARREAPERVRDQKRCIADEDYVRVAEAVSGVAAAVEHRWAGSRPVHEVYVDSEDAKLRARVQDAFELERLIGTDVVVRAPRLVGVIVALRVRVVPSAQPSDVARRVSIEAKAALDAQKLTLGKRLFASWLVAAALKVPGVADVALATFKRWDGDDMTERGYVDFGPTERAVLVDQDGLRTDGRPLVEVGL